MEIDAVVLAHNSTNRIYKKNSILINYKALVEYTVQAALESKSVRKTFLLTNDEYTIKKYKNNSKVNIVHMPEELTGIHVSKKKIALYLIQVIKTKPDIFALLSSDCPLRTGAHIDDAVDFASMISSFDSVVSVTMDRNFLGRGVTLDRNKKINYSKAQKITCSLNNAIFIFWQQKIAKLNEFLISDKSYGFPMEEFDAFNVDTPLDVALAEALIKFKEERVSPGCRGGHNVERMYIHDDLNLGIRRNILNKASYDRHFQRYRFFLKHIESSDSVLDIACGSGYGSEILASKAKFVYGVDSDKKTIQYAKRHHLRSNAKFKAVSLESFRTKRKYDKIISIETIEHIADPDMFLKHAKKWLKPGGVLWLTCPLAKQNRKRIDNPFHINEMSYEELNKLVKSHFKNVSFFNLPKQNIFLVDTLNNKTDYVVTKAS